MFFWSVNSNYIKQGFMLPQKYYCLHLNETLEIEPILRKCIVLIQILYKDEHMCFGTLGKDFWALSILV